MNVCIIVEQEMAMGGQTLKADKGSIALASAGMANLWYADHRCGRF